MTTDNPLPRQFRKMQRYLDSKDRTIKDLYKQLKNQNKILAARNKRVDELEQGCCRFNCRTAKDNWCDGFVTALCYGKDSPDQDYERAKDEWKRKQETPSKGI